MTPSLMALEKPPCSSTAAAVTSVSSTRLLHNSSRQHQQSQSVLHSLFSDLVWTEMVGPTPYSESGMIIIFASFYLHAQKTRQYSIQYRTRGFGLGLQNRALWGISFQFSGMKYILFSMNIQECRGPMLYFWKILLRFSESKMKTARVSPKGQKHQPEFVYYIMLPIRTPFPILWSILITTTYSSASF